ncbi:MAG: hypothetical protein J7J17_03620 [Hadesarchaea archaeon]|nr:hypothetical protein [Hadesarchaea archaeon]
MREILGSRAAMKILQLFCQNPRDGFYTKEIERKARLSKATTIKWLKKLSKRGILGGFQLGRKKVYRLRWQNSFGREIWRILAMGELVSALDKCDLSGVYLFGPSTRGQDPPDSPLDILVLSRADPEYISKVLDKASRKIGKEIRPLVLDPLKYSELRKRNPSLYERIEREKIRLLPL